ncbi:YcaO-like family protein (plasmid) [Rhizobium sp. 32-5/1]|uniref:YcaO-like family protein n=1 Tax=Rhizobium sp. 32-5/1 TaxID=3019602 RepID=UPI00240CFE0D|nr:YcaO-like family protein [Rhizobium sp. 32-5/1]WEZ85506.1 YcaO-like family protein [Rhizobium sp. 32-5/1]
MPEPPEATAPSPIYSDRICSADETLSRITPFLPSYGITRVSRLTDLDTIGVPVWSAVSPNARSIVIHHGKGITDADARVSATMEALERAIAGNPSIDTIAATRASLRAERQAVNSLDGLIAQGQMDITDEETIEWVRGTDVLSKSNTWVPREAIVLDRTPEVVRFWQSSDGLASGNTLQEASFHGVLERIERDAETLWNIADAEHRLKTCCDPFGFQDPVIDGLVGRIDGAALVLRLFDITSDIGIACFAAFLAPTAIATKSHPRFIDVTKGSGAHPDPVRAAIRAITEAIQSRLTYISGARDDIYPEIFKRPLPLEILSYFAAHPKAMPLQKTTGSVQLDVMFDSILRHLRSRSIGSVVMVPLTPPDFPFSVAKVLVPDLENPPGARKRRFGPRAISKALFSL